LWRAATVTRRARYILTHTLLWWSGTYPGERRCGYLPVEEGGHIVRLQRLTKLKARGVNSLLPGVAFVVALTNTGFKWR
jgi:hypothetical protein